jgi:hypothetical protein
MAASLQWAGCCHCRIAVLAIPLLVLSTASSPSLSFLFRWATWTPVSCGTSPTWCDTFAAALPTVIPRLVTLWRC